MKVLNAIKHPASTVSKVTLEASRNGSSQRGSMEIMKLLAKDLVSTYRPTKWSRARIRAKTPISSVLEIFASPYAHWS